MKQLNLYKTGMAGFYRVTRFIVLGLLLNFNNAIAQTLKANDSSSKRKLIEIGHPSGRCKSEQLNDTNIFCGYHASNIFVVDGDTIRNGVIVKSPNSKRAKKKPGFISK